MADSLITEQDGRKVVAILLLKSKSSKHYANKTDDASG